MSRKMPNWARLWPGLPDLWIHGSWAGLALALGFTVLLNVLLLGSLVWTRWLPPTMLWAGWGAVVVLWACSFWVAHQGGAEQGERKAADLLRQATEAYLQGRWFAAESLLERLVQRNRQDVQARLMLATLKRRTGRLEEARVDLENLALLDAARPWLEEIRREQQSIRQGQICPADDEPEIEKGDLQHPTAAAA